MSTSLYQNLIFFPSLSQSPCPPIKCKHSTQRGEPLYATHADNDVKDKFNFCFQRNLKKSLDKFFSKQNQLLLWIVTAVGVEKQLCYPTASRFPYSILWSESIDVYTAISLIVFYWCEYCVQDTTTTLTRTPIYWSLVYLGFYLNLKNWSILCVNLQIPFNQPSHVYCFYFYKNWRLIMI